MGSGAVRLNSTDAKMDQAKKASPSAPSLQELDKAAAASVLKLDKAEGAGNYRIDQVTEEG